MTQWSRRLMLVEDSASDAKLLSIWLRQSPLVESLTIIPDADQAKQCLANPHQRLPDLLLLDVNLPCSSGFEILRQIRQDPRSHRIHVIMLTSSVAPQDRERAEQLGADLWIAKPCDAEEFTAFVQTVEDFITSSGPPPAESPGS